MTLLENFYYGNLIPSSLCPQPDDALRETAYEAEQKLKAHFSPEEIQLFIDYSDKELSVYSSAVKDHFLFGFRLGMLLLLDVLKQADDLIG